MKLRISFLEKISVSTLLMLLFLVAAVLSYLLYPVPLYFFHKKFLNIFTPGLSLAKPVAFFLFMFLFSIVKDFLPKSKFTLPKWLTQQAIMAACFFLIASLGFMVFSQNVSTFNAVFPQHNVNVSSAYVTYVSYEAKTLFFYSLSRIDHYHENKALLFPLAKYLGVEGDVGEAIYPFYPLQLKVIAYLLFGIIFVMFIQSLRMLEFQNKKLSALLTVYYLFIMFRMFHIVIDGGVLASHFVFDTIAFIFFTLIIAYANYPHNKVATLAPYTFLLVAPILRGSLKALITILFKAVADSGTNFFIPYLLELLIGLAAVTFLTRHGTQQQTARQWISLKARLNTLVSNRTLLLAAFMTLVIVGIYATKISALDIRTAFDDVSSYAKGNSNYSFLTLTTSTSDNPCNQKPVREFVIKNHYLRVYNQTPSLSCSKASKYYAYATAGAKNRNAFLIIDCTTAGENTLRTSTGTCYATLQNNYDSFIFSAEKDLADQHLFFVSQQLQQPVKPPVKK